MNKMKTNKRNINSCKIMVTFAAVLLLLTLFSMINRAFAYTVNSQAQLNVKVLDSNYDTKEGFAYGSGDGSSESKAFLIASPKHLDNVRNYAQKFVPIPPEQILGGYYFKIICDIDMEEYLSEGNDGFNGGKGWEPIKEFNGIFDGGNYNITNFYINRPDETYIGLFGVVQKSEISNINLRLSDQGITANYFAGGIAADLSGDYASITRSTAVIKNCSVIGNVTVVGLMNSKFHPVEATAGGIVGSTTFATISNCYVEGIIEGKISIGGIAGFAANSNIINCYFNGSIDIIDPAIPDTEYSVLKAEVAKAGGIAGQAYSDSNIINCYYFGTNADERVAAIAGHSDMLVWISTGYENREGSPPSFQSCYYNKDIFTHPLTFITGEALVTGGSRGLTADEIKNKANFEGWDFDIVWGYDKDSKLVLRAFGIAYEPSAPQSLTWLWITLGCTLFGAAALTGGLLLYRRKKAILVPVTSTIEVPVYIEVPKNNLFPDTFSAREREIGELLLMGMQRKEIADQLFLSENTIKKHLTAIYEKSGCATRHEFYTKYYKDKE